MITVQLNGGLGNQFFQYAAAKSLSLYHKVPLQIDVSWFYKNQLHYLEIPREFELYNFSGISDPITSVNTAPQLETLNYFQRKISPKLFSPHKKKIYVEPFYHFDSNFFKARKDAVLSGQWQSEKYFKLFEQHFRNTFSLKPNLIENCLNKAKEMNSQQSVSVHVRRADYLRLKIILEWHGIMSEDYYSEAFKILDKKLGQYYVYYFADDIEWVKANLLTLKQGEIISATTSNHYEDFYLMSQCRHNIIANSSFSWWAAWLNNNPDKIVIAPKNWFNDGPKDTQDLIPDSWIKI